MITLTILDNDRMDDESFLKMLLAHQENELKNDQRKNGNKSDAKNIINKIA
jgi:hypothetical protein